MGCSGGGQGDSAADGGSEHDHEHDHDADDCYDNPGKLPCTLFPSSPLTTLLHSPAARSDPWFFILSFVRVSDDPDLDGNDGGDDGGGGGGECA